MGGMSNQKAKGISAIQHIQHLSNFRLEIVVAI